MGFAEDASWTYRQGKQVLGSTAYPHSPGFHDSERIIQSRAQLCNGLNYGCRLSVPGSAVKPDENYAG